MNANRFAFADRYFYYFGESNSDLCCGEMPVQD